MGAPRQKLNATEANDPVGMIVSRNPATGQELGRVPEQSTAEIRAAVAAARAAQRLWAAQSVAERAAALDRLRDLVVANAASLSEAISNETGKTPSPRRWPWRCWSSPTF